MHAWLTWLLVLTSAASISRLITVDQLPPFPTLRDYWEVHWLARIDRTLVTANRILNVAKELDEDGRNKLRKEMYKRADDEPNVPLWVVGRKRRNLRPWSSQIARLERYAGYGKFFSCWWCVPFWVFVSASLVTWGWFFDFTTDAGELFTGNADVPAWAAVLLAVPLAARWLFGLAQTAVEGR